MQKGCVNGCSNGCGCTGCLISLFDIGAIIQYNKKIKEEERILSQETVDIDNLDGFQFERFIEILYKDLGFKANRTPSTADYGADLILSIEGQKVAIQIKKRKSQNIGVDAVQEVYTSMKYYQVESSAVITNRYFTNNAKKLAEANGVKLIDRDVLLKLIDTRNKKKENLSKAYLKEKNKKELSQFRSMNKKNQDKTLVKNVPYKNKMKVKINLLKVKMADKLKLYKNKIIDFLIILKEKTNSKINYAKNKMSIIFHKYKNKIKENIEKLKRK